MYSKASNWSGYVDTRDMILVINQRNVEQLFMKLMEVEIEGVDTNKFANLY